MCERWTDGLRLVRLLGAAVAVLVVAPAWQHAAESPKPSQAGAPMLTAVKSDDRTWGIALVEAGLAGASQPRPVELEFWSPDGTLTRVESGYQRTTSAAEEMTGEAEIEGPENARFAVRDRWHVEGQVVRLSRTVTVGGGAAGGFMSGVRLDFRQPKAWTDAQWFAPGMIYGGFDHLTETAIGGRAHYRPGDFTVRIREDRLPAPLMLAHFVDDTWLAILNPAPRGDTTAAEGADVAPGTVVDERMRFGAIGAEEREGKLSLGYWYPGSEGQVTYAGDTFPGGQLHAWRRRYHPIREGMVQEYEVCFRIGRGEPFPDSMATAWRWAWDMLDPKVQRHDISAARRVLVDMLAENVVENEKCAGIPIFVDAITGDMSKADRRAIMGFCGKNLEAANYMLQEAALEPGARSDELRRKAETIVASFMRLRMSPPEGEGFYLDTGAPINSQLRQGMMFLRSFGDDLKKLLHAYEHEKRLGRDHGYWLRWCRAFADWLLPQQREDGGFPRAWTFPGAEVASASPNSSFNAIPLLVHLARITDEQKYLDAAIRAGEFCWANGQSRGRYVGGTIDNPDVLDKEAATLSLEAYLALYEATRDDKWLSRARGAANYAETWIYLWNVPMPPGEDDAQRHWKKDVSTVGVQLIATGHSLVDQYMAFDADDFARLYAHTGDTHYYDVARLLLHNTKNMLALPGRPYDLAGLGWQQEHWSMAPPRGQGMKRGWLPWVSTSHLNGIFGLKSLDADLAARLIRGDEAPAAQESRQKDRQNAGP